MTAMSATSIINTNAKRDVDTTGDDHDFDALKYGLKLLKNKPAELKQVAELNEKAKRKDKALISIRF